MSLRRTAGLIAVCLGLGVGVISTASGQDDIPVLDNVVIEGATRTDARVIERLIAVEPGEPFDYDTFEAVWDRLEDSGYFAFVDLDMSEPVPGRVALIVRVEEDTTLRYGPHARYSRRHKYLLGISAQEPNLRGKGEILDIQAVAYRIQRLRASWTKPWFLGRDGLSLEVGGFIEQGPFVWRPFDYREWEAGLRVRQAFGGPFFVELGGDRESFNQRDTYDWPAFPRDGGGVTTYKEATRATWRFDAGLGLDSRDNPFYPREGLYSRFAVAYRTGGDGPDFVVTTGDARAFVPLPTAAILAMRAYGQLADQALPVERALFWGGPETVRGAPYAQIEGDEGYLLTAEIRYPLFLMPISPRGENVGFGLHAFTDVGDAWSKADDPARARLSFGGGAHLNVLSWQLRFEAAKEREHDWTFVFMDQFTF